MEKIIEVDESVGGRKEEGRKSGRERWKDRWNGKIENQQKTVLD